MTINTLPPPAAAPWTRLLAHPVFAVRPLLTARSAPSLDQLSEHLLRDIGMSEDQRFALIANRERKLERLRAHARRGPFFVPLA